MLIFCSTFAPELEQGGKTIRFYDLFLKRTI